jgi:hypothetical protein
MLKMIILPRQARDKHRQNSKKRFVFRRWEAQISLVRSMMLEMHAEERLRRTGSKALAAGPSGSGSNRGKQALLVAGDIDLVQREDPLLLLGLGARCEKRARLLEPCLSKNDHFAKTGSGQTQEKLRKRRRFVQGCSSDSEEECDHCTGRSELGHCSQHGRCPVRTANCIMIDHSSAFESGLVTPFLYAA